MVGHGKLDPAYSLSKNPDLVISCRAHGLVMGLPRDMRTTDVVLSFLGASSFQDRYRSWPVSEDFLLGRTSIYTHAGSPEARTGRWKPVDVRLDATIEGA